MSLASEILARRLKLPRAQTRDVACERDLPVEMDDGAVLLADRWVAAAAQHKPQPTVLVRSPYGRRAAIAGVIEPLPPHMRIAATKSRALRREEAS